jgi:hypothetical protein
MMTPNLSRAPPLANGEAAVAEVRENKRNDLSKRNVHISPPGILVSEMRRRYV